MTEVTINTIKEVIHRDGQKYIEIDYYEWNDDFEKWEKFGETQRLSPLILPEFVEALKSFT